MKYESLVSLQVFAHSKLTNDELESAIDYLINTGKSSLAAMIKASEVTPNDNTPPHIVAFWKDVLHLNISGSAVEHTVDKNPT